MDAPYTASRNSFHLARLILAVLVVLTHAYTLVGAATPLNRLTGGQMNEGTLAVDGFLVISGFLICQSGVRNRSVLKFLRNRVLRLLPALLCALVFSAFFVGGLAYGGTFREYLFLGENGPLTWIWNWLTLNVQGEQWGVTGVFSGNATTSLNVSLWTIKHEVFLYLLMAVLILTTLNRRRPVYIVLYAAFLTLYLLLEAFGIRAWDVPDTRWWVLSRWNYPRFVETGTYFFAGTLLYAYRDALPRHWYLAVIAAMALVMGWYFGILRYVLLIAYPYLLCYLAASPVASGLGRVGDLSLGVYLYAYPLQQLAYHVLPELPPMGNFGLTLAFVLPIAWWSWRHVEAPALSLKR